MNNNNAFYQSAVDLIQNGKSEKAIGILNSFLKSTPDDETALSLLSSAYLRVGQKRKAIDISESACISHPDSYAAHADLGFLSMKLEQNEKAISSFQRAVKINQRFYPAWVFLGKLYFESEQYSNAVNAEAEAEKHDPLENEFRQIQKFMQQANIFKAEQIARAMLQKQPGHPRASLMLAYIAGTVEAHEESADILEHCLSVHPANLTVRRSLINAYEDIGDDAMALKEAKILLKTEENYVGHSIISKIYGRLGDHERALFHAEVAAKFVIDNKEELGKLDLLRGHALKILGSREESEEAYRSCIKNRPKNGSGWWGLADFKTYNFSDNDIKAMQTLAEDETGASEQRCQAAFALAKAFENNIDMDNAIKWYIKANELRTDVTYDRYANEKYISSQINTFNQNMLKIKADPVPVGSKPIFILGMPRAGSTLIEQILSSHSQIEGTMELPTLPKLERKIRIQCGRLFKSKYPAGLDKFNSHQLSEFGQDYIENSAIYRTNKAYFIDKFPPNFIRVGLIHKLLPQAIIIDARRHPLDCGYSIFKQHFAMGHNFSYDLKNIGNYYNDYLSIMDHWDKVLPGKVLCVQYEDMIHKTEETVKSILDHIGVEFEESCMKFYENKRAVKTASSEQVRQPIYTKGIGQWKPVKHELTSLFESLGSSTLARFEKYLPSD